jgi:hypothetical protein
MNFLCRSISLQRSIKAKRCSAEPLLLSAAKRDCAVVSACRTMMLPLLFGDEHSNHLPLDSLLRAFCYSLFGTSPSRTTRRLQIYDSNCFGLPAVRMRFGCVLNRDGPSLGRIIAADLHDDHGTYALRMRPIASRRTGKEDRQNVDNDAGSAAFGILGCNKVLLAAN